MRIAGVLIFCLGLTAQTKPAATAAKPPAVEKSAFDKATLEAYLRHVELVIPQVSMKIDDAKPSTELPGFFDVWVHLSYNGGTKDDHYLVSKDGKKILKGEIFDVNKNPFQSNIDRLKTENQPTLGPANAPVTLVVYSDFQCPVCKEEAQVIRQNVAKTFPDKVKLYFKDFPLDSIHNWARTAAIGGRCVYRQDKNKFWDYFDWAYENQQSIGLDNYVSKLQAFASEKGLDGMQLGRCMDTKATEPDVTKEVEEGHMLGIAATPTLFVNGRKIEGGVPWQNLEALINLELDHQAQLKADADKCCEVTIPKLVK
jgi:protein-disulfide isomerase